MAAFAARRSTGPVLRAIAPPSIFNRRCSAHSPPPRVEKPSAAPSKRTCLCAPTNHPGSFRCSLHKGGGTGHISNSSQTAASYGSSGRLTIRRSAMKNSLVRIGTADGGLARRALAALIRPSSHHQRRRGEFRRHPSRLSVMSGA